MSHPNDRIEAFEKNGKLIYQLEAAFRASTKDVWAKISDVDEIRRWDSSMLEISGEIRNGGKVTLRNANSPKQKFKLKISGVIPHRQMIWSSGLLPLFKGVRTYSLREEKGHTVLLVEEVFEGWLLGMMKSKLPDCETLFGTYAADLRKCLNKR